MNHARAFLSRAALAATLLGAALSAQDVHEQSVLEVRRQPFRLQWVNTLSLDGPWLAAGGTDIEGFSALALYRRDGATWVPRPLRAGGDPDLDGNRLVVADTENNATEVYRLVNGQWTFELFLPMNFASLEGNRLITARNSFSPPFDVSVWTLGSAGWAYDTALVPDSPQDYFTCCREMTVFGNTAAFLARSASGEQSVQVYVRDNGRWMKQSELSPSLAQAGAGSIGTLALSARALVSVYYEGGTSTAVVWERDQGAWTERALLPQAGLVQSLALKDDMLAMGTIPTDGKVHVYQHQRGEWKPRATLAASNGQAIGAAVAIDGRTVVAGTHGIIPRLNRIYVFRLPSNPIGQ